MSSNPSNHPAAARIRDTLKLSAITSGTCSIPVEQCELYYKPMPTTIKSLNLATASSDELAELISACKPAPFGRDGETVLDETYRKALKLDVTQFAIPFDLSGTSIIHNLSKDLIPQGSQSLRNIIRAEPYKLNVYDEGAFFKAHKDTPRSEGFLGSLVVVFPTPHEGGALILRENAETAFTFDAAEILKESKPEEPEIAYVAFFGDIEHEVLPVKSGARVTFTYNLYLTPIENELLDVATANVKYLTVKQALEELAADPEFLPDGGRVCFGLGHQYPVGRYTHEMKAGYLTDELEHYLKGGDALIYAACRELDLDVEVKLLYPHSYNGDIMFLASEPVDDVPHEGDDSDDSEGMPIFEGLEKIKGDSTERVYFDDSDDEKPMVWITQERQMNQVEAVHVSYGNEASVEYVYGDVFLVAEWGPFGERHVTYV